VRDALEHVEVSGVAEGLGDGGSVAVAGHDRVPGGLLGVVGRLVGRIDVAVVVQVGARVPDGPVLGVGEAGRVGAAQDGVVVHIAASGGLADVRPAVAVVDVALDDGPDPVHEPPHIIHPVQHVVVGPADRIAEHHQPLIHVADAMHPRTAAVSGGGEPE